MSALVARVCLTFVVVVARPFVAPAQAQTAGQHEAQSVTAVMLRLPPRATVFITDASARRIQGTLLEVNAAGLRVQSGSEVHVVATDAVRLIEWQRRDSPWSGVLIGAGIGAIPGIYWLIADPNECTGMCPEELALIGIGAAVGGLIDHMVAKRVTVFRWVGAGDRRARLSVAPWTRRDGHGLQLTVRF